MSQIQALHLTIVHFIKSLYVLYVHIHVKLQNAKSKSVRVQRVEGGQITDVSVSLTLFLRRTDANKSVK